MCKTFWLPRYRRDNSNNRGGRCDVAGNPGEVFAIYQTRFKANLAVGIGAEGKGRRRSRLVGWTHVHYGLAAFQ
jgi:hypothetical protein